VLSGSLATVVGGRVVCREGRGVPKPDLRSSRFGTVWTRSGDAASSEPDRGVPRKLLVQLLSEPRQPVRDLRPVRSSHTSCERSPVVLVKKLSRC
jgi:hypothetical protein